MLLLLAACVRPLPTEAPRSPLTPLACAAAPAEGPALATDTAFLTAVADRAFPGATADPSRRVFVSPGPAFAISTRGAERQVAPADLGPELAAYLAEGAPWGEPCLGVWSQVPDAAGKPPEIAVFLDHTKLWAYDPADRPAAVDAARAVGRAEGQQALYDFGTGEVIEVGE